MRMNLVGLLLLALIGSGVAQRRQLIQDMIENLRTKPKSSSLSPSFNGEINFDLIGSGGLPLQGAEDGSRGAGFSSNPSAPSIKDVITGSISRFETSNLETQSSSQGPNVVSSIQTRKNKREPEGLPFFAESPKPFSEHELEKSPFTENKSELNKVPSIEKKPIFKKSSSRYSEKPQFPSKKFQDGRLQESGSFQSGALPNDFNFGPPARFNSGFNDGPHRFQDGPHRLNEGTQKKIIEGGKKGLFNGPPRPFNDVPPTIFKDGPPSRFNEGPPSRLKDGPPDRFFNGPPKRFIDGPPNRFNDGPPSRFNDGPHNRFNDGPPARFNNGPIGLLNEGPPRRHNDGPPSRFNDGPSSFRGQRESFHSKNGPRPGPSFRHKRQPGDLPPKMSDIFPPKKSDFFPPKGSLRPGAEDQRKIKKKGPRRNPDQSFNPPEETFSNFKPAFLGSEKFNQPEPTRLDGHSSVKPRRKKGKKRSKPQTPYTEVSPPSYSTLPTFPTDSGFGFENSFASGFGEQEAGFGDQGSKGFSLEPEPSSKPKRQSISTTSNSGFENEGFFAGVQESFPDLSDFGMNWEPEKIRTKRSALKNPFYYRDERPRRQRPNHPSRQTNRQSNRRSQGPTGFWDDADFDSDFFNGGGPSAYSYDDFSKSSPYSFRPQQSGEVSQYRPQEPAYRPQEAAYRPKEPSYRPQEPSYRPQEPFRPQEPVYRPQEPAYRPTEPAYRPQESPYTSGEVTALQAAYLPAPIKLSSSGDYYSTNSRNSLQSPEDNEILGSGNFDIVKGGTFYTKDEYQYIPSSNSPQQYSHQYVKDFFHNFRDFADIKEENYK